jgi:hypothetical protein
MIATTVSEDVRFAAARALLCTAPPEPPVCPAPPPPSNGDGPPIVIGPAWYGGNLGLVGPNPRIEIRR